MLKSFVRHPFWQQWGILLARLIIAFVFFMAAWFKFSGIDSTATAIASIGWPFPVISAWLAAFLELLIGLAFLTGLKIRRAALVSAIYILFLAFSFHGPSMWGANPMEFGFFVDHFTFIAGLLYVIAFGSGNSWTLARK